MIVGNRAANGGGLANGADGTARITRSTFWDNRAVIPAGAEEAGLGGGVFSQGDASAQYENVTITGNFAQARGGRPLRRRRRPRARGRTRRSPATAHRSPAASAARSARSTSPCTRAPGVIFRNSIVAGNLLGPSCCFAIGSEGGNIAGDASCYFAGPRDRTNLNPRARRPRRQRRADAHHAAAPGQPRGRQRRHARLDDRPARRLPPAERRPRQRRLRVAGPVPAAGHDPARHRVPRGPDPGHRGDLALPLHRHRHPDGHRRPGLRVPPARGRPDRAAGAGRPDPADRPRVPLRRLPEPVAGAAGRGGAVHVRGPRDRPRGQRRPDARHPHLRRAWST